MNNLLTFSTTTNQDGGGSLFLMLGIYAVFFVALYFIFFRPQNKRKKMQILFSIS